jgi:hypothetical protein
MKSLWAKEKWDIPSLLSVKLAPNLLKLEAITWNHKWPT